MREAYEAFEELFTTAEDEKAKWAIYGLRGQQTWVYTAHDVNLTSYGSLWLETERVEAPGFPPRFVLLAEFAPGQWEAVVRL